MTYESWGIGAPWADVIARSSTVRWPAVEAATATTADGRPVSFETLIFALAAELGLPGFGKGAMSDRDGEPLDLECAEDFYLRAVCNIAYQAGAPVAEASDDDIAIIGLAHWMPEVEKRVKPEEVRRVAMVMSRGGRFDRVEEAWDGDRLKHQLRAPVTIWSESVGRDRRRIAGAAHRRQSRLPGAGELGRG